MLGYEERPKVEVYWEVVYRWCANAFHLAWLMVLVMALYF
jgi:hypothetical protein